MDEDRVLARLAELGLELPPPPRPVASYVPVVVTGGLAFVAGQVATEGGAPVHPGRLGEDVSVDQGREAAARCALQALSALRAELGSLSRLERIVQLTVFVASAPGFGEQPKVADGASGLLLDLLGEAGQHARAAVGVAALPLGAPVEVALVAAVAGG